MQEEIPITRYLERTLQSQEREAELERLFLKLPPQRIVKTATY
jgi:hypothetical protein